MNGYEAMAIMALVLDEATEKAIRDPQFTRYAFDLGDLARQMRYTARMTQEYLKALDVDCKDELEADMAAAEVIELTHIARSVCKRMGMVGKEMRALFTRWEWVLTVIEKDLLFSTLRMEFQPVEYYCCKCGSPMTVGNTCPICNADDCNIAIDIYASIYKNTD